MAAKAVRSVAIYSGLTGIRRGAIRELFNTDPAPKTGPFSLFSMIVPRSFGLARGACCQFGPPCLLALRSSDRRKAGGCSVRTTRWAWNVRGHKVWLEREATPPSSRSTWVQRSQANTFRLNTCSIRRGHRRRRCSERDAGLQSAEANLSDDPCFFQKQKRGGRRAVEKAGRGML
jgi:hypothetical protein